jgi:hypothetical protein
MLAKSSVHIIESNLSGTETFGVQNNTIEGEIAAVN